MTPLLVAVGTAIALLGWAIVVTVKRAREIQVLAERGRPAHGRVVDRRATRPRGGHRRNYRVQLMYEMPDTGERRRWIGVSSSEWEQLLPGTPVDLVYLPDKPAVFALRSLVDRARRTRGSAQN
jgi:hypothetical protein